MDLSLHSSGPVAPLVRTCRRTRPDYPDSGPARVCSYSLLRRSNNAQCYSLWFDMCYTTLEISTLTLTPPMHFSEIDYNIQQQTLLLTADHAAGVDLLLKCQ